MIEHIATDLRHRTSQDHSATQALFMTCLFAYISLAEVAPERWNARSRTSLLPRRWHTYFSYLASGPPGHRLEELVALAEAGVVRFLGGDVELDADDTRGVFTARGSVVLAGDGDAGAGAGVRGDAGARAEADAAAATPVTASATVTTRTLIDAWLPEARASRSDNALLRQLVATGRAAELSVTDAEGTSSTGQIGVAPGGRIPGSDTEFALGPFVAAPSGGAFTRPGLDSLPFRMHDRVARAIVDTLAGAPAAATASRDIEAELHDIAVA